MGEEVYSLYEDSENRIWFSVENFGVYRYDGNSFYNYNMTHGLITGGIQSILHDKKGRFWFGGWLGLFEFDNDRFSAVSEENLLVSSN